MWRSVKLGLCRFFYPVAVFWWQLWSWVYRKTWHRKYENYALESGLSPVEVFDRMRKLTWTKDGPRELWDAIGSPGWVQFAIDEVLKGNPQPKGGLDCDDYSSWAVRTISNSYTPFLFSFSWLDSDAKVKGHVVCMFRTSDGMYYHVGNWGLSEGCPTLRALYNELTRRCDFESLVGWCTLGHDLFLDEVSTKPPPAGW